MNHEFCARRQSGAVLLVALIMLLLVTLMAFSGYKITQSNLMVVGNLEHRDQVVAAANATLDEAISSTLFFTQPGNIFIESCGAANTKCYDYNNDGVADVRVSVTAPRCVTVTPISNAEALRTGRMGCVIEGGQESLCAEVLWELQATAVDELTGARASARQGVSVWASRNNVASACPN